MHQWRIVGSQRVARGDVCRDQRFRHRLADLAHQLCRQHRRHLTAARRIRRHEDQAVARGGVGVGRGFGRLAATGRKLVRHARQRRHHGQAHLVGKPQRQRAVQQRLVLAGALVGFEHLLPVVCRQADADRTAGEPIRVIRIRRDQRAAGRQLAPPAEGAVGAGQQRQTLTLRAQQRIDALRACRAAVAQARAGGSQTLLGKRQRDQAAGGLLGAAVRILDQVIRHAGELAGRVADHAQAHVARIGRQA